MRIIGGSLRRRTLESPSGRQVTRPMPDLVRESVFNLLRGHCEGAVVLDLFSGSGAVGLEAVSRGATRCVMVEKDRGSAEVIERNVRALGVEDRCEVVRGDALSAMVLARVGGPVHLVFFDPPYAMMWDRASWERCLGQLSRLAGVLDETGYLVVRTPWPAIRRVKDEDEHKGDDASGARKRAKGRRENWRVELDREGMGRGGRGGAGRKGASGRTPGDEVELEAWEIDEFLRAGSAKAEQESGDGQAPRARFEEANLSIEGAMGPETHEYGRMGVHLYMRRR